MDDFLQWSNTKQHKPPVDTTMTTLMTLVAELQNIKVHFRDILENQKMSTRKNSGINDCNLDISSMPHFIRKRIYANKVNTTNYYRGTHFFKPLFNT